MLIAPSIWLEEKLLWGAYVDDEFPLCTVVGMRLRVGSQWQAKDKKKQAKDTAHFVVSCNESGMGLDQP